MKMNYIILLFFALLSSYISPAFSVPYDFCVANLNLPNTPSGYPCKTQTFVTVNDFVFSGFVKGPNIVPFNVSSTSASVDVLPGLNGLGISAARVDMDVNGTVPIHFHPDATELLMMIQGQMTAGIITPNQVYVKNVKPGDVMVFPKGLLHFQINSGVGNSIAYAAYSSTNPPLNVVDYLLFKNNLPTSIISQTTLLDPSQIIKLKALFGGTG